MKLADVCSLDKVLEKPSMWFYLKSIRSAFLHWYYSTFTQHLLSNFFRFWLQSSNLTALAVL